MGRPDQGTPYTPVTNRASGGRSLAMSGYEGEEGELPATSTFGDSQARSDTHSPKTWIGDT